MNPTHTTQTYRIVALWAFIECSLGGVAHALKLPFTGLYVGGGAIFCISLIACYDTPKNILTALMSVLSIKFLLNPHSPLGAYIAVTFQGLLGYVLFRFGRFSAFLAMFFGCLALMESAVQKVAILTLFYGKSLHQVSNKIFREMANWFGFQSYPNLWHIFYGYVALYACVGIFFGFYIWKYILHIQKVIEERLLIIKTYPELVILPKDLKIYSPQISKKMFLSIIFLAFLCGFLYYYEGRATVLFDFFVSLLAIVMWYVVGFVKILRWVIQKIYPVPDKSHQQKIIDFMPYLQQHSQNAWQESWHLPYFKRWIFFLDNLVIFVLFDSDLHSKPKRYSSKSRIEL